MPAHQEGIEGPLLLSNGNESSESLAAQVFAASLHNPFCVTGYVSGSSTLILLDFGTDTVGSGKNSLISWALVNRLGLPTEKLALAIPCTGIVPGVSAAFTHECTYALKLRCENERGKERWVSQKHTAYVANLPKTYDIILGAAYFLSLVKEASRDGNSPGLGFYQRDGKQYFHFYTAKRDQNASSDQKSYSLEHVRLPLKARPEIALRSQLPDLESNVAEAEAYDDLVNREITLENFPTEGGLLEDGDEVILASIPPQSLYGEDPNGICSMVVSASSSPLVFNIGSQEKKVKPLLERYSHLFAEEMPTTAFAPKDKELEAEIILKPGATPPKPYNRRYSPKEQQMIQEEVDKLLRYGFIEPSTSPWVSNVLFVKKKDTDEMRFCVDFRAINRLTEDDRSPIPNMSDVFTQIVGSKYFSSLDLRSGFHQWFVKKEHRKYTCFFHWFAR